MTTDDQPAKRAAADASDTASGSDTADASDTASGSDNASGSTGVTASAGVRRSAPRRTLMAAERTYLAWLRTGLGAIGVSLAVGRLLPALIGGSHAGYVWLGAGYGVLGLFFIAYALLRARRLQAALVADEPVTLDWWALVVATVAGLSLAVATIVMVLAEA